MKRRDFLKYVSLGAVSLGMPEQLISRTATAATAKRKANILWIMMDDGRADALGCYGKSWAKTPNMDRIAKEGVRFKTAIVQNPVCVPSRSSMDTGRYCRAFGIMAMGKPAETKEPYLKQEQIEKIKQTPCMLDAWNQAGIQPTNVGKIHAYREAWLQKGDRGPLVNVFGKPHTPELKEKFEEFDKTNPYPTVNIKTHRWMIGGVVPIKPEETQTWCLGDMAVKALKEMTASDKPFFLRVSFHAPHVPCRVPPEYMIDPAKIDLPLPTEEELKNKPRFEREQLRVYAGGLDLTKKQIDTCRGTYYGMVSLVDTQVGRLLKVLEEAGQLDNTIIAINSDQGFQLGEHGLWKKRVLYDQNVCIPFIFSCPKLLPKNKVIDEPVEMVDFLPTLMDLSQLKVPTNISGRSLMPLIEGKVKKWREACFCEIDHSSSMYDELRTGTGRRVMVRTKEWKLIYFMDALVKDKDGALYNLLKDPGEIDNLYNDPKYKHVIEYLEGLAKKWDENI